MFRTSMLAQEESPIFEELLSRFGSLGDEQMLAVGVTPEWSAKDLLAHLAYWERAAAEQVQALNAGTWSPKKCTREERQFAMCPSPVPPSRATSWLGRASARIFLNGNGIYSETMRPFTAAICPSKRERGLTRINRFIASSSRHERPTRLISKARA